MNYKKKNYLLLLGLKSAHFEGKSAEQSNICFELVEKLLNLHKLNYEL